MKKQVLLFFIAAASLLAAADNYFSIGNGERLRVSPDDMYGDITVPVSAHFDGRLDSWRLEFTFPSSVRYLNISPGAGMIVPYKYVDGSDTTCTAVLTVNFNHDVYSSTIIEYGYWDPDNDGIYESYGTVKWGPGDYDVMFNIQLDILGDCTGDTITIDGHLTSTPDSRGNGVNTLFFKKFGLVMGYAPGDVTGDSVLTLADVTALVNYLLTDEGLNAYQLVAADVNEDGYITIDDVTVLTNILLTQE